MEAITKNASMPVSKVPRVPPPVKTPTSMERPCACAFGDSRDNGTPFDRHRQTEAKRRAKRSRHGFPVWGPRSLSAMATAVLAKNAHQLSAEHVEELSDERREALKKAIVGSCDLSAKLWKILLPRKRHGLPGPDPSSMSTSAAAAAAATTTASLNACSVLRLVAARTHMFCSQVRAPTDQLGTYIDSLTTPSMEFVAHIRIMACGRASFGHDQLIQLASMPNLGILEIIEINLPELASGVAFEPPVPEDWNRHGGMELTSAQANDKLMRGWCSTKPVPFPELRVLRLWGCMGESLSPRSLEYAAAFPKLAYFEISVDVMIHDSDERTRKLGPGPGLGLGLEDGPRGAWMQVHEQARMYGWHGFKYHKSDFEYASDDRRLDPVDSSEERRPQLTLNMVERNSTPLHAANWGGRIYSFAANQGYGNTGHKDINADIERLGRSDAFPITHNIASLSLGVDRVIKSYQDKEYSRDDFTFVFVRTNEQLQAQAEANRKYREVLAEQKARKAAERRAQAEAAMETGLPRPAAPEARKRVATASDPGLPRKLRRPASARETMRQILGGKG